MELIAGILLIILIIGGSLLWVELKAQKELSEKLTKQIELLLIENDQLRKQPEKSVSASRNTVKGQISEQLALMLPPAFGKYNLEDAKFFGNPIDFIIFENMSYIREGGDGDISIIFADVKTGKASLSPIQKKIKAAVENKRIRWETIRIDI